MVKAARKTKSKNRKKVKAVDNITADQLTHPKSRRVKQMIRKEGRKQKLLSHKAIRIKDKQPICKKVYFIYFFQ